jgi:hypothetical protein
VVVDVDLERFLDAATHYTPVPDGVSKELWLCLHSIYSQALSPPTMHVGCLKFAFLDTLQHGLPRDPERLYRFAHRQPALGRLLDESRAQLRRDADAPGRARDPNLFVLWQLGVRPEAGS